jgi:hypothetical protein
VTFRPTSPGDISNLTVADPGQLTITCPTGYFISAFPFASYGTATGNECGSFATSSCALNTTTATMVSKCVGLNSCSVSANVAFFGRDPCLGIRKSLKVCATCSPGNYFFE